MTIVFLFFLLFYLVTLENVYEGMFRMYAFHSIFIFINK